MLVAVGNGPSYGGGMRVCPDAGSTTACSTSRCSGRSRKLEFIRVFPQVYTGTHVRHPAVTVQRAPRRVARRRRRRRPTRTASGSAALPVTCEVVPGALHVLAPHARRLQGMSTPGRALRRLPASRGRRARELAAVRRAVYAFELDPFQVAPARRSRPGDGVLVAAPTGAGKTVVGEFAVHLALGRGPQVLLHDADQGAVQPEVRRPGARARRRHGRPAHRRQRDQRRGAGRRDDHRGAAQHALRRLARPCAGSATS